MNIVARAALVALTLLSSAVQAETLTGRVVGVSDGDTLTVLIEHGGTKKPVKIRLAEIDAPESKQPWGSRAKSALSRLAFNKQAKVEVETTDRYGRKVGRVYVDGIWVNGRMVDEGHAWVYRQYSKNRKLMKMEEDARAGQRGLWSLPESKRVPPWEWRHGGKSKADSGQSTRPSPSQPSFAFQPAPSGCGGKRSCGQMSSCAEARYYLNHCGLSRLDQDGDGVPCESLCSR